MAQSASTRFTDPSWNVEQCVRCAVFPDNPALLFRYLSLSEESRDWMIHKRTFLVLLATVRDERLPEQWRRLCLDYAYKPLVQMRLTATSHQERIGVSSFESALRQLGANVI